MIARIKILILWLWMAVLLTATVGITVQQIYCYCVGESTFSIFDEAIDACTAKQEKATDDCCKIAEPNCCTPKSIAADNKKGCTKKSVKVFRLKTEFLVGQPLDKSFECPVWADEVPECFRLFKPVLCEVFLTNKAPPPLPPPLSGRTLCLRHELFRC